MTDKNPLQCCGQHTTCQEPCTPKGRNLAFDELAAGLLIAESIQALIDTCYGAAVRGGWWHNLDGTPKDRNDAEMICLMHSELSEAMEGVRKNLMDDKLPHRKMVEVELADCIIRICDFAGGRGLDVGGAIVEKLAYNAHRADHKPENRAAEGGKKF